VLPSLTTPDPQKNVLLFPPSREHGLHVHLNECLAFIQAAKSLKNLKHTKLGCAAPHRTGTLTSEGLAPCCQFWLPALCCFRVSGPLSHINKRNTGRKPPQPHAWELIRYKGRGIGGVDQYQNSTVSLASMSRFAGQQQKYNNACM